MFKIHMFCCNYCCICICSPKPYMYMLSQIGGNKDVYIQYVLCIVPENPDERNEGVTLMVIDATPEQVRVIYISIISKLFVSHHMNMICDVSFIKLAGIVYNYLCIYMYIT